jgi:CHAT domain-containing protein/tetratricopeptide (TPR) repeat protein
MWLALLLLLALTGCGGQATRSALDLCRQGRTLLQHQQYAALESQVDAALRHVPRGSRCYWQLRLLRVEALVEARDHDAAEQALNFELPSGAQWTEEWARYRLGQANIERLKGNLDASSRHLDEAQDLARAIGASGLLAEIDFRRAVLAMLKGKLSDAEAGYHHVVDEAIRQNDPYLRMRAEGNLGYMLADLEYRFEEAIPWDERMLASAQALGAANDQARAMLNLGWSYTSLQDLDKAQPFLQEAARRFESNGNRRDAQRCLGDMAGILFAKQQYQAAGEMYQRALKMAIALDDREDQANWLNDLALIAIKTHDWDAAERYNNAAWALWKGQRGEYHSMVKAGRIANGRRDFGKAEQFFRSVISARPEDPALLLNAHANLAFVLANEGRNHDAEAEYLATDAAMEHQRTRLSKQEDRLGYFSGQIDFYQYYVDFLVAQHRSGDALRMAESSRARGLMDRLRLTGLGKTAGTAVDFEQIAKRSGSVLLSYWVAPDATYLWVVTGSSVNVFTLPGEARIRALVKDYDDFIQGVHNPLETENPAGRRLYDTLLAPAAGVLSKTSKVIIVPDGPLYGLNFETLPVPGAPPHYWIEDATISVTPSLDLLSPARAARQASQSLLLIGNPVSPVAQYPTLDFAAQEIAGIRQDLSTFRQVVREKADAEPGAYARASPAEFTYIHFVAHAVANSEDPLESAVILSNNGTDYKLRARDVLATPVHASLVTLSACRSAGARIYAGEGLVGLSWAFLQAGANNVIAGLWDVTDRSTAELMTRLYAGIARGDDPARALRDAKLAAIHSSDAYQKPYYWGPFELFTRQAQ